MKQNIIDKVESYGWEYWLERPFGGFMISLFKGGNAKKSFEKIGIKGVEVVSFICQNKVWYQSQKVWHMTERQFEKFLKEKSIFDITKSLDKFYKEKKERLKVLSQDKTISNQKKLAELAEIMSTVTSYLWTAHALEVYYVNKLKAEVPKYVTGDLDLFIGDASFPSKKNTHALLEEAVMKKVAPEKIAAKFGWIKSRDGFSPPFTVAEIKQMKANNPTQHKNVEIPKPLKRIFKEVQELVYFRTYRTDVFYELIFSARPILREAAKLLKVNFEDLADYSIYSLINGKPEKIKMPFTAVAYKDEMEFINKELFRNLVVNKNEEIRGVIAQKGVVIGTVKVIRTVADVDKVKKGDIMVARMTFPAYIMGMKKAGGFITDEGGITCHAAIVAREMKKPCIIGTKVATKILKDGDRVEIDANSGIVKIINA